MRTRLVVTLLEEAEPDRDPMSDFFAAVRSRRPPRANADAGFAHALATTMAGMSLRMGVRVKYDAATDTVHPQKGRRDEHALRSGRPGESAVLVSRPTREKVSEKRCQDGMALPRFFGLLRGSGDPFGA